MLEKSIQCFCTVVETGSFTKASEQLFISQPSVSKYVRWLEREWDVQLLVRHARHVTLTPKGEVLYNMLRRTQVLWEETFAHLATMDVEVDGLLRVGLVTRFSVERFRLFPQFQRLYEKAQVELYLYDHSELNTHLLDGSLDLIFQCGHDLPIDPHVQTLELCQVPSIVMLSATHPLAENAHTIDQLGAMDAFALGPAVSPGIYPRVRSMVARNNWKLHVVGSPNPDSIYASVDMHKGCAFSTLLNYPITGAEEYKIFPTGTSYPLLCAWDTRRVSTVLATFLDMLRYSAADTLVALD